jgi:DNA polymerase III subunit chi
MAEPQVEFHSGVTAPVAFACRLLRKAVRQGVAVSVVAPPPLLQQLDRELWTFEPLEFVAHLRLRPGQPVDAALRRTPVWLCEGAPPAESPGVLLNLGVELPVDASRYGRIIELVSTEPEQRQAARARWRECEARGWPIRHHTPAAA